MERRLAETKAEIEEVILQSFFFSLYFYSFKLQLSQFHLFIFLIAFCFNAGKT